MRNEEQHSATRHQPWMKVMLLTFITYEIFLENCVLGEKNWTLSINKLKLPHFLKLPRISTLSWFIILWFSFSCFFITDQIRSSGKPQWENAPIITMNENNRRGTIKSLASNLLTQSSHHHLTTFTSPCWSPFTVVLLSHRSSSIISRNSLTSPSLRC